MKSIRLALVGIGGSGSRHAIVFSRLPNVELVAGADPLQGQELFQERLQSKWFIPGAHWYADEHEMLEKEAVNALMIAADPASMVVKKLPMLKHFEPMPVLWERPMGYEPEHPLIIWSR